MEPLSKFVSRKYSLAVLTLLSATGLVAFRFISDGVYSAVLIANIASYIAGNVFASTTGTK